MGCIKFEAETRAEEQFWDEQPLISKIGGISIVAWLFVARGCGKQSGSCHFQSGPHQSSVRSNAIPDFRDLTMEFVTIYLWALYCPDFPT